MIYGTNFRARVVGRHVLVLSIDFDSLVPRFVRNHSNGRGESNFA